MCPLADGVPARMTFHVSELEGLAVTVIVVDEIEQVTPTVVIATDA